MHIAELPGGRGVCFKSLQAGGPQDLNAGDSHTN